MIKILSNLESELRKLSVLTDKVINRKTENNLNEKIAFTFFENLLNLVEKEKTNELYKKHNSAVVSAGFFAGYFKRMGAVRNMGSAINDCHIADSYNKYL